MWETVFVGISSSIIATVIWYVLSQLWKRGDRKQIGMELEIALTSLYEIEQKIGFPEDYQRILIQIDRMYDSLNRAYGMIKPLTYGLDFGRKRMIVTIIWENIRLCDYSKNITVGYSKFEEIEERCLKIERRLKIKGKTKSGMSMNLISLFVAKNLNDKEKMKKTLHKWMRIDDDNELKKQLFEKHFIEINTFKDGIISKNRIKYHCFTRKGYERYIDKELKRK